MTPHRPAGFKAQFGGPLKDAIAGRVHALLRSRGEAPLVRRADSLFGPQSVAWRVHGDVATMMIGGTAGLLLQMLHPAVLAGVWDHSNFRSDMQGRLQRTARFIAVTTYGAPPEAEALIGRVRAIHDGVRGSLPDGTSYAASDPALLAWVHLAGASSFLDAWIRYAEPGMPRADQDRYFCEMAKVAEALGAQPVPRSRAEASAQLQATRPELRFDNRTREVSRIVLEKPAGDPMTEPLRVLVTKAAVDLLPPWVQRMHGVHAPTLTRPLVRVGALGLAQTLRWALG
jgi:uncharacterized protein (DUF2236 family)